MQITPLGPGSLLPDRPQAADGVGRAQPALLSTARPVEAAPPVAAAAMRTGLQGLDAQRNARVASAQQALAYLDLLAPRLQNLRADLSRLQSGQPVPAERLESQRQRLAQTWSERGAKAGGELDAQLHYTPGRPAAQGFTVRGLDAAAAAPAARETLTLALGVPSAARPSVRVALEADTALADQARAFDRALQPLGIAAGPGAAGGLRFEVDEARWPQVRGSLAVQGEGRRYPAGRLHQLAADAEPGALAPQDWVLQEGDGAQAALQQITGAERRAETARQGARAVLEQDRSALAARPQADDADWARRFSTDFAAQLRGEAAPSDGAYRLQAALGASVAGLGRQRVDRLLETRS